MKIFTGRRAVLPGVLMLLCWGGLSAQASQVDLSAVLDGINHAFERADDMGTDDGIGQNLDGSLKWKEMDGEETWSLRLSFNRFRFYITGETPGQKPIITFNGSLEMDDDQIMTGSLTVEGLPSLSSISFDSYRGFTGEGTVTVNKRYNDTRRFHALQEEAADYSKWVNTLEIESALAFYWLITAMGETDLDDQIRETGESVDDVPPPGIRAVNPENTVTVTTWKERCDLSYAAYAPIDAAELGLSPVFSGAFSMGYEYDGDALEFMVFTGTIQTRNLPFLSSIRFDGCRMGADLENSTGTVTINGAPYSFQILLIIWDQFN
jgi:hypothetical protein